MIGVWKGSNGVGRECCRLLLRQNGVNYYPQTVSLISSRLKKKRGGSKGRMKNTSIQRNDYYYSGLVLPRQHHGKRGLQERERKKLDGRKKGNSPSSSRFDSRAVRKFLARFFSLLLSPLGGKRFCSQGWKPLRWFLPVAYFLSLKHSAFSLEKRKERERGEIKRVCL